MYQINGSVKDYIEKLFSPLNPVYFALFATLLVLLLIYLVFKYIVRPLNRNHELEKQTIELRNSKIMALFAELDPNPIIRISKSGAVIFFNDSANKLTHIQSLNASNISSIITGINFSMEDLINQDKIITLERKIDNKFYMIDFIGIKYLEIAQVYFKDVSRIKQYERQIRIKNQTLKKLYNKLYDQLEEERLRIARELHDTIGQNLLLVQLNSRKLRGSVETNTEAKAQIQNIDETIGKTVDDIREIIYDLKPKLLEEIGLKSAVESLCINVSEKFNIRSNILMDELNGELSYRAKLTIFRIIQEAINNIIKHSEATEFNIQFFNNETFLKLLISDNGVGFSNNHRHMGLGLSNMKERIEYINGKLKIDSLPGHGTLLIFEIKKEEENNGAEKIR
jgi:two-component system, NarL family, sensor kinase